MAFSKNKLYDKNEGCLNSLRAIKYNTWMLHGSQFEVIYFSAAFMRNITTD
jgi:hypothetical protein